MAASVMAIMSGVGMAGVGIVVAIIASVTMIIYRIGLTNEVYKLNDGMNFINCTTSYEWKPTPSFFCYYRLCVMLEPALFFATIAFLI